MTPNASCLTHTAQGVREGSQIACVKFALRFGSRSCAEFIQYLDALTGVPANPGNYGLVPLLFCHLGFTPSHRKLTVQFGLFA